MDNIVVLMSTFNGEEYLSEQLTSIFQQVGVNVFLIIRDDGSSDKTLNIINLFLNKYPKRIILISGNNIGYRKSFSELITIGLKKFPKCNFFAFCDQDDVWLNNKLLNAINTLKQNFEVNTKPILYCSNTELVNERLDHIRYGWKKKEVLLSKGRCLIQSFGTGCTMVFNRVAANYYIKLYHPNYPSPHDYFMYQTCIFLGAVIWDENSYIKYRQHQNNQIGRSSFFSRMRNRIKSKHYKEHALFKQNATFLRLARPYLKQEDIDLLETFCNYNTSFVAKIKLIVNKEFQHSHIDTRITNIIKILLGTL